VLVAGRKRSKHLEHLLSTERSRLLLNTREAIRRESRDVVK
jgi:hypothetical protein